MAIFTDARKICEIFRRDGNAGGLAFQYAAQRFSRQLCDFPLKRTHTRFPRVIADQITQSIVADREFLRLKPMGFDLLVEQMSLRNLQLLVLGIALQPDDFHAVQKRLWQIKAVGRCHEHHVGQVQVDFEIMVIELVVLFRIENLKQCRRRITAEILPKLVDFVEQEQRVHRSRFFQIGRDLTGHRTNIGPAMATNLCFITHAAKRLTDKLTPRCLRN